MSSPRKFAEKIALIQQKQAEGDAAFNRIINEVEVAKQRADQVSTRKSKLDVPRQTNETSSGINNVDSNNYMHESLKIENGNGSNRLLLPPDNLSGRRTFSDSSLNQTTIPNGIPHYYPQLDSGDNNQQLNYDINCMKFDTNQCSSYPQQHHLQMLNSQIPPQNYYDLNNNNYTSHGTHNFCQTQTLSIPQQNALPPVNNTNHMLLNARYSGESNSSNVLMLPPNQYCRSGGSLPDLRIVNPYNNPQVSFSTVPSTSTTQQFLRSPSPQQNSNEDFFVMGSQKQSSSIGPLKTSPSMRRRHSPIGNVKQSSPRRQTSPSPDVSPKQQTFHLGESPSPQSQSNFSSQNSPNLLSSPGNERKSFSSQQQSIDSQQTYFTLPTHFDQISLDNNFYGQQQHPSPPSPQQQHNHQSSTTSGITSDLQQTNYYPSFMNDISSPYDHNQSMIITPTGSQKSPTIPDIILTDVDSSKLDFSKEFTNDFLNTFDQILNGTDLQLNDDFLLNAADLPVDQINCDDAFCSDR